MTVSDFMRTHPNVDIHVVWAADTKAGFGKKGDTVYGDCWNCRVVEVVEDSPAMCNKEKAYTLRVWIDALGEMEGNGEHENKI